MGRVIDFPSNPVKKTLGKKETVNSSQESLILDSVEEEKVFFALLLEWPCFFNYSKNKSLKDVLEDYYDDKLSVSEDYAIEYMFHMHNPKSKFDISGALCTWDETNRNFFLLSLSIHAEVIHEMVREKK